MTGKLEVEISFSKKKIAERRALELRRRPSSSKTCSLYRRQAKKLELMPNIRSLFRKAISESTPERQFSRRKAIAMSPKPEVEEVLSLLWAPREDMTSKNAQTTK